MTLPAGTAGTLVSVTGLSPGNFYLLLTAPGTQLRGVTGTVNELIAGEDRDCNKVRAMLTIGRDAIAAPVAN